VKPREPEKKPIPPKPSVVEKGLYVAFESDRVFMDLLGSEKIFLYIKVTGVDHGFRVIQRKGDIQFNSGSPAASLDLWEVQETMIPAEISEKFREWTTLASKGKILVVGLTPEISAQIRGQKRVSGRFIIGNQGKVTYTPHGE